MMEKKTLILVLAVISSFIFESKLLAQAYQKPSSGQTQLSRYVVDTDNNLLSPVNILGLVQKPGQYMVPYRTDLITLIALAGGFREDAKISKVKIIRDVAANGRNETNGHYGIRSKVYVVDVKRYFEKGDQTQIPQLMPDDTIIVTGSTTRAVNKIFDFVGKGIMLAQLYFLIKVANDR